MADIIVRKRIALDFLGEEHNSDYLVFKAIPVDEYKDIANKQPEDNIEAIDYIVSKLKERFIEGRYQEQDIAKPDIGKFPAEVITECFAIITGQKISPKS